jgi:hypothetical protein
MTGYIRQATEVYISQKRVSIKGRHIQTTWVFWGEKCSPKWANFTLKQGEN